MRVRSLLVALLLVASAGCVVEPSFTYSRSTFEGFDVVAYVPAEPVGLVYVFHGTGGSARFAEKLETVDLLNTLTGRGYAFVATDSTDRVDRQWATGSRSLTDNADLARLARLHAHLVATTSVGETTPIMAAGMSNGAAFASVFAQSFADAGYPVRASAMFMGRIAPVVRNGGGLTVPTYFVAGENDPVVAASAISFDHATTRGAGIPTSLYVAAEKPLTAARFLRIPGVDGSEAQATFDAFVSTGSFAADGTRLVPIEDVASAPITFPASLTGAQRADVRDQVEVVLAVHEMRADAKVGIGNFFDAHR